MISIMIPCFLVDNKLGDWISCRIWFRDLYKLEVGSYLTPKMGIGGLIIVEIARSSIGDYRTLEDRVEHHRHWISSG